VTAVLEISGLQKTYRGRKGVRRALDGFDMVVDAGQVHGFLGPNGSGKTTTLRTLLGLIKPNAGRMAILGRELPRHLPEIAGQVGAIVESPQFFGNFTARDTLLLLADAGGVDRARVYAVLELVGLRERAKERVKTYSLGMKQRLAVASALLKNPRLLILDEPANGLDPEGIAWMRTLLRDFADRGGTVLLSSHLLAEVQATVDQLVVIAGGTVVASGPLDDLLASTALLIRSPEPDALHRMLIGAGIPFDANPDRSVSVDTSSPDIDSGRIAQLALDARVLVTELRAADTGGLEQLFFSLTSGAAQVAADAHEAA
jgi:ABC-2 type transport system ATP-binding protein